jgi:hypothetical protein
LSLCSTEPERVEKILLKSRITAVLDEVQYSYLDQHSIACSSSPKDSDSDEEDDYEYEIESDSASECLEDLSIEVQCLIDLEESYEFPACDTVENENTDNTTLQITNFQEKAPEDWWSEKIAASFPKCDPSLIQCLGQQNWRRFNRCVEERERNYNTTESAEMDTRTIGGTKFHDSGIGTSVRSYAETVTSFVQHGGGVTRIPPLPESALRGEPFECMACYKQVTISQKPIWK